MPRKKKSDEIGQCEFVSQPKQQQQPVKQKEEEKTPPCSYGKSCFGGRRIVVNEPTQRADNGQYFPQTHLNIEICGTTGCGK